MTFESLVVYFAILYVGYFITSIPRIMKVRQYIFVLFIFLVMVEKLLLEYALNYKERNGSITVSVYYSANPWVSTPILSSNVSLSKCSLMNLFTIIMRQAITSFITISSGSDQKSFNECQI